MKTLEDMQKSKDVAYGLEVRKRRDDLRITQKKLAKRIGIKQTTLSSYELGLEKCPAHIRMRIEKVLGPIDVFDNENVTADPARDDAASVSNEELPLPETRDEDKEFDLVGRFKRLLARPDVPSMAALSRVLGVPESSMQHLMAGRVNASPRRRALLLARIKKAEAVPVSTEPLTIVRVCGKACWDEEAVRRRGSRRQEILPIHQRFADLLVDTRAEYGLTQVELAGLLNVGASSIIDWEATDRPARMKTINTITRKIQVLRQKLQQPSEQIELDGNESDRPVNTSVLHKDPPAVYEAAAAVRDNNSQLPIEDVPESQPADMYKEYASRERDRQYYLAIHGLNELNNEAFYKLLDYLNDMKCNKKNLDSRFAGVGD